MPYEPNDEIRVTIRDLRQRLRERDSLVKDLEEALDSRKTVLSELQERYNAKCLEVSRLQCDDTKKPEGPENISVSESGRFGAVIPVADPEPIPAEDWSEGSLRIPTVAKMLDMSSRTVRVYMDRGDLRWGRLGRERRIPRIDVIRLLTRG